MKRNLTLNGWRTIALIVLLIGAVGSLSFTFYAGRQTPVLLLVLFVGWVISPFVALVAANKILKRWTDITRLSVFSLMIFISIGSLVSYSGVFNIPETKPAFIFLVVPLVSWLLMVFVILIAQRVSRKNNSA